MEERRQSFATFSLPGNIRSSSSPSVWGLPSTWTEATSGSTLMAAQEDREGYKVKERIYLKLPGLYSVIKITFGQNYWFSLWLIQCVKFREKIIFTFPSFWRPPIRPRLCWRSLQRSSPRPDLRPGWWSGSRGGRSISKNSLHMNIVPWHNFFLSILLNNTINIHVTMQ